MVAWMQVSCGCCGGIKWGGESPEECGTCGGSGQIWLSENDRLALYPGGPFSGFSPGLYNKMKELSDENKPDS